MIGRDVRTEKRDLRAEMRGKALRVSDEERARAGELICRLFHTVSHWGEVDSVMFYHPLPGEPDIRPLIERALGAGKTVTLPRFDAGSQTYRPVVVRSLERDLREAFDDAGRRLGRGVGYYDRILEGVVGDRVGIAFDWQMTERVPEESHDVRMDRIVTPSRYLLCKEGGK
jgi:5-formyltetrahydrofolate cyclo-ligase